jgi:magnesium transporter
MADADSDAALRPHSGAPDAPPVRDHEGDLNPGFVALLEEAIEAGDSGRVVALVEDLHESDLGDAIEALVPDDRTRLIELLGPRFDFAALTEVDDSVRDDILDDLKTDIVAEGVRELDADDAVRILEDLEPEEQAAILRKLPAIERDALQRSLDYPEDSAGRRMQTSFIAAPPFWSVGETIDHMRDTPDLPETFYEIFVVDPGYHLLGAVALDKLLRSPRAAAIGSVMTDEPDAVRATDPQDDVARLFQRRNLVSAAVVDEANRLVGAIMIDDVVDVIEEEADADIKALGGVNPEEEISQNVLAITRGRFWWLFVNLLTAFLASSVLKGFEHQLERMVALAVLAPIVASQGGNAATQTMTVAVRALATRDLGPWNMTRVIVRETAVGLLNGIGFALITGALAAAWFASWGLGVVIGLAMIVNLVAAALAGILVPLALDRWGADPAVSSGAFVTTVTDVVGFFSFLGIATLWFGLG